MSPLHPPCTVLLYWKSFIFQNSPGLRPWKMHHEWRDLAVASLRPCELWTAHRRLVPQGWLKRAEEQHYSVVTIGMIALELDNTVSWTSLESRGAIILLLYIYIVYKLFIYTLSYNSYIFRIYLLNLMNDVQYNAIILTIHHWIRYGLFQRIAGAK